MKIIFIIIVSIVSKINVILMIFMNNWFLIFWNCCWYIWDIIFGIVVVILLKIRMEILLFIFLVVICLFNYIKNVVLVVSIVVMYK